MLAQRPAHEVSGPVTVGHRIAAPAPSSRLERKPLCPKEKLENFAGERRRMFVVCSETSYGGNRSAVAAGEFPDSDFLSCCYLCRKRLQGKDIYMYRGEMAFCSKECRFEQIVTDEFLMKKKLFETLWADFANTPISGDRRRQSFEDEAKLI